MATTFEFPKQIDLTHFISEQAHDLKSPFNRILGFTKVVLNGMDGPVTDLQKEDLTTVFKNSAYALVLMSCLVDIARFTLGEKAYNPKELEISDLFAQSIKAWQQSSPGRNVQFQQSITMPTVLGDEILLRQMIAVWISYLTEYLSEPVQVTLAAESNVGGTLIRVAGSGQKSIGASECDLSMFGYIGQAILNMHQGKIHRAEGNEQEAGIEFILPR
jgi:K+-sensing histidine kinase KdpD